MFGNELNWFPCELIDCKATRRFVLESESRWLPERLTTEINKKEGKKEQYFFILVIKTESLTSDRDRFCFLGTFFVLCAKHINLNFKCLESLFKNKLCIALLCIHLSSSSHIWNMEHYNSKIGLKVQLTIIHYVFQHLIKAVMLGIFKMKHCAFILEFSTMAIIIGPEDFSLLY